jgi:hypothetical protein
MNDLLVRNEGSLFLLAPITPAGRAWIDDNIPDDAQTWGDTIVVEPRYIQTIVTGAIADGLNVGD